VEFDRKAEHLRCDELEALLQEVNGVLSSVEANSIKAFSDNKYPLILIMGCARSGTTLFMQWLANLGYFSYPTNILSRFYGAPFLGAKIQKIFTTLDKNEELFGLQSPMSFFESRLGKTKGALSPNEFWYFWRRFFKFGDIQKMSNEEINKIDFSSFLSEIAAIESVFNMPFAMKGMIANWIIPHIADRIDKILFIHIIREPISNMQSLLKAREDYFGNINAWYSFKPPEYEMLKCLSPFEQIAGQLYFTNKAIYDGVTAICPSKVLRVSYEEFCKSPDKIFLQLKYKLQMQGYLADWEYSSATSFRDNSEIFLPDEQVGLLLGAYRKFSGGV